MHVGSRTLNEVELALVQYREQVNATDMTPSTKKTYLVHSENFVRWLKGEFVPGLRKQ